HLMLWSALSNRVMVSGKPPGVPGATMIDTDAYSAHLRAKAIDLTRQALLITDLRESRQEEDLSEPVNCGGNGRIRHCAGHFISRHLEAVMFHLPPLPRHRSPPQAWPTRACWKPGRAARSARTRYSSRPTCWALCAPSCWE